MKATTRQRRSTGSSADTDFISTNVLHREQGTGAVSGRTSRLPFSGARKTPSLALQLVGTSTSPPPAPSPVPCWAGHRPESSPREKMHKGQSTLTICYFPATHVPGGKSQRLCCEHEVGSHEACGWFPACALEKPPAPHTGSCSVCTRPWRTHRVHVGETCSKTPKRPRLKTKT